VILRFYLRESDRYEPRKIRPTDSGFA
jgi:hypothetical protein